MYSQWRLADGDNIDSDRSSVRASSGELVATNVSSDFPGSSVFGLALAGGGVDADEHRGCVNNNRLVLVVKFGPWVLISETSSQMFAGLDS